MFGLQALTISFPVSPSRGPHVEVAVYEWKTLDDTTVCIGRLGDYATAAAMLKPLLERDDQRTVPPEDLARMRENLADWESHKK